MNKILLIIKREYFSRVRKKSFLLMTFLVPGLIIGMYAMIFFLLAKGDDKQKNIMVLDESGIFTQKLQNKKNIFFQYFNDSYEGAKKALPKSTADFLLYIPKDYPANQNIEIISEKKPGISLIGDIENQMETVLQNKRLVEAGIDTAILNQAKERVSISAKQLTQDGEKDASIGASFVIGFIAAFMIYMSLLIYGTQVMRGVIEEKTNRIIEVIVSSVKPFQLMMGKIIGIGLVGLTQFLLWIVLSAGLATIAGNSLFKSNNVKSHIEQVQQAQSKSVAVKSSDNAQVFADLNKVMGSIDYPYILGTFLFYFLGGYLIYSALFAAVGSAVDNETETQQFMLPITMPLIFSFIISINFIVNNPDSSISFWLSMIPLTSPVAMMIRIPYGVPTWELILSMTLLAASFFFITWIASRIYRVGILMYGKKSSYKELAKWLMYRE